MFGTYQYPDFPMESGKYGAEPGRHIPARAVHEYLKSYADQFDLTQLIRLNTKVVSAEHQEIDGGWILNLQCNGQTSTIRTKRLIVASGFTSEPNRVSFVGQENFGGRVFHGREFHQNADTVKAGQSATVYGSTKYAWDAVYAYATAGADVHWVIRGMSLAGGSCLNSKGRVANLHISKWPRPMLDDTAICDSSEAKSGIFGQFVHPMLMHHHLTTANPR